MFHSNSGPLVSPIVCFLVFVNNSVMTNWCEKYWCATVTLITKEHSWLIFIKFSFKFCSKMGFIKDSWIMCTSTVTRREVTNPLQMVYHNHTVDGVVAFSVKIPLRWWNLTWNQSKNCFILVGFIQYCWLYNFCLGYFVKFHSLNKIVSVQDPILDDKMR